MASEQSFEVPLDLLEAGPVVLQTQPIGVGDIEFMDRNSRRRRSQGLGHAGMHGGQRDQMISGEREIGGEQSGPVTREIYPPLQRHANRLLSRRMTIQRMGSGRADQEPQLGLPGEKGLGERTTTDIARADSEHTLARLDRSSHRAE